jgi:hypothetical protein
MLTLHQFSRYSTGARYDIVTGLGTYLYSTPTKGGMLNIYQLYDFIVEVLKSPKKEMPIRINASPAARPGLKIDLLRFNFN